ncbi:MAG: F0F1 ATP synthase subunit B [Acidimicrobiales bacterium]
MLAAVNNFLVPNATFFVELAVFLALFGIVARFIGPPLKRAMDRRQREIQAGLERGEEADRRLHAAQVDYQAVLDRARREARVIKDEARVVGDYLRQDGRQKGQEEHDRLLRKAEVDIEAALARAREKLRREAAALEVAPPPLVLDREREPAAL